MSAGDVRLFWLAKKKRWQQRPTKYTKEKMRPTYSPPYSPLTHIHVMPCVHSEEIDINKRVYRLNVGHEMRNGTNRISDDFLNHLHLFIRFSLPELTSFIF
jgi:hypothetical protein